MVQGIMGNPVIWETSYTNDRGVSATRRGKKTCRKASRSKVTVKGHGCTDLKGVGSLLNMQTHQKYQVRTQKTALTLYTLQ